MRNAREIRPFGDFNGVTGSLESREERSGKIANGPGAISARQKSEAELSETGKDEVTSRGLCAGVFLFAFRYCKGVRA